MAGNSFGPNWPKASSWAPDPKGYFFATWKIFPMKLDKILHKMSPLFWKLDDFWQSYEGLYPKNYKKKT